MRRAVFLSLVVIAANLSGCAYHMQQCGSGGCGSAGTAVGPCASCGRVGCGGACRGGFGLGPLGITRYMATCGAGCGGLYVNEWVNDPPDACDPCDDHGNWIGAPCCLPRAQRWLLGARNLWGYRFDCGGGGGCVRGCTEHAHDGAIIDGEVIYDGPVRGSTGGSGTGGSGARQGEEELLPPRPVPEPEPAEMRQTRSVKKPWRQSSTSDYYPRGGAR